MPQSIPLPRSLRSPWALAAVATALLLSGALVMNANAATLAITTTTLHDGAVGQPYASATATLAATGGTSPYSWSVDSGSLPAGLALSSAGVISGTPTVLGNTTFTVKVTDSASNTATQPLTIKVNPPVVVQTSALAPVAVNAAYTSPQLVATGGTGTYTWTVSAGTLTPLTLSVAGVISGTAPAAPTTLNFTVQAMDSAGHSDQQVLSIVVTAVGALTITTPSLPNGVQSTAYPPRTLTASGGVAPYTWALEAGSSLPAGLALSAAGVISGTPTGTGNTTFTVKVTDTTVGTALTATKQFTIAVMAPIDITTASPLPAATLGTPYATVLAASGGTPAYVWAAAAPPAGLNLSASTGALTGTPTAAGTTSFDVQVTDFHGYQRAENFSLTVNAAAALTITTTSLPNALINADYTQQLTKTGGSGTITWTTTTGTLPTGLVLSSSGLITGIPTVLGASTFTVQAVGSLSGTDTQSLAITVASVVQPPAAGTGDDDGNIKDQDKFHGLCNAFFQGSENGRKQKAKSTAFQRLISAAGATGDWQVVQDKVRTFCETNNAVLQAKHDDDDNEHEIKSSSKGNENALENQSKNKGTSNGQRRDD